MNHQKTPSPKESAYLVEVFSAIQGEGLIVGSRQIFIRFLGCHISCAYCDTPATHTRQRHCRVEQTPGKRDFRPFENPLPGPDILKIIESLDQPSGLHDSISLTGGEPLQHIRSLLYLMPLLKPHFPLYLETDGILYENLEYALPYLDMIGMDMKLPSATLLEPFWDEHLAFLKRAARKEVFVKLVVSAQTPLEELDKALEVVSAVDRSIPLVLQPVTPYGAIQSPPSPEQLLTWQSRAKQALKTVRAIPQSHKMMGQI